jgi:transposase
MAAADMFRRGKRQVDVVNELGVSAQTASRWYRAWQEGGRAALAGADRAGRLRKLSEDQLAQVQAALVKGPRANGFATEMWTLARVAEVIETVSGVRYSQTQTWTILRQRLGWSRQRPARRAVERNDEAIATWVKQDWPRIKKRAAPRRLDHLPRRERVLPPPTGESDLGAERPDTSATAPVSPGPGCRCPGRWPAGPTAARQRWYSRSRKAPTTPTRSSTSSSTCTPTSPARRSR